MAIDFLKVYTPPPTLWGLVFKYEITLAFSNVDLCMETKYAAPPSNHITKHMSSSQSHTGQTLGEL